MPAPPPGPVRGILFPATNQLVLVAGFNNPNPGDGKLLVQADQVTNAAHAFGHIQDASGFTMPATIADLSNPPSGLTRLPLNNGIYQLADFPIAGVPAAAPGANNKHLTVGYYDTGGNRVGNTHERAFKAWGGEVAVSVSAKYCIWLINAASGQVLNPFNESTTPADGYVPPELTVPVGATSVRITGSGGPWQHDPDPATQSGPEGRVGTDQPLDPNFAHVYQNNALGSDVILSATVRLNRLVGLWALTDATAATTEFDVGVDSGDVAVPEEAKALHLGFHDGFQWSNNSGTVNATVVWTGSGGPLLEEEEEPLPDPMAP